MYSTTTTITLTTLDVTLDAQGNPDAVFIFRATTSFGVSANKKMILANGARAENVFWIIKTSVVLAADTETYGTIVAGTLITIAANCAHVGRLLSLTTGVTIGIATGVGIAPSRVKLSVAVRVEEASTSASVGARCLHVDLVAVVDRLSGSPEHTDRVCVSL